jgi:dipeptidyl-peptidase 4
MKIKLKILLSFFFILFYLGSTAQTRQYDGVQQAEITLEDLWMNYSYYPKMIRGYNPMNDGVTYTILTQGNIDLYSYKTGKMLKTLVEATAFIPKGESKALKFNSYSFSDNESKLMIVTNVQAIYRHSFAADYWIYDLVTKELKRLSTKGKQQLATFSPDGTKVAFVRDNNLFYTDLQTGNEFQVTLDGKKNEIINGAPDWVYEEEFSFSQAFEWSPDGSKIAFIRFDESKVREFEITEYGTLYPEKVRYKYPKAGEENSKVEVHVFDLIQSKIVKMDIGPNTDIYIPRISWTTTPNSLSIQRLNRLQNHFEILIAEANSGMSRVIYDEKSKYYIDITDNLIWLEDAKGFLISSEKSGYNHLYHFDMNGDLVKQLTEGSYEITEVNGLDPNTNLLYFVAAKSSPLNREVMRVNIKTGKIEQLSTHEGTNSPEYSNGFKYYVNTYTNLNSPPIISVHSADGKMISVLEDNYELVKKMETFGFGKSRFFNFTTDEGVVLNGWMIKPLDFDSSRRYPVLMYVYGGPGSQTVANDWGWFNYVWFQMLAQKGYIVVSVDGRGTGFRGEEFKKSTYLKMGELETKDQIASAQYLSNLPFVDGKRIGIFGWSFGGYMSSLCMTVGSNYFSTGIAVAPVTNWRHYDNIYTERFMRTPSENGSNYDLNSPVSHVDKLKGKFLLVHGNSDDNVHVENSMDLINAMVKNNKQFEMQLYPNNNHNIGSGPYTRFHLYKRMTDFIIENL